jgi:hypothetical protein
MASSDSQIRPPSPIGREKREISHLAGACAPPVSQIYGTAEIPTAPNIGPFAHQERRKAMKETSKTLVAIAFGIGGGLLVANPIFSSTINLKTPSTTPVRMAYGRVSTISALVESVNWASIEAEPLPPTF